MPKKTTAPAGAAPVKVTAAHIRRGLRKHFPDGRCGIVFECAQGTGARANRHIDALAMDLWPSHGLGLHAIEIKVDRADWRRELANPAKAEEMARFADFFWVAAPPGIIPIAELPPAWGLLEGGELGMRVIKPAQKTPAHAVDRNLLAAVFRASSRSIDADESAIALAAERQRLADAHAEDVRRHAERLSENNSQDSKNWRALMKALGEDTDGFARGSYEWDAQQWIKTIKAVHRSGVMNAHHGVAGMLETIKAFQLRLQTAASMFEEAVAPEAVAALKSIGKGGAS